MELKDFFEEYPEFLNYLEYEEYDKFSNSILALLNSYFNYADVDPLLNELTYKLYEADLLDDMLADLGEIPEWCKFKEFTSYNIPNSVTSIGWYAFYNCSSLTSITIPDSVTSIGDNAFFGCSSLTSITIPDSVTSVGDSAFYYCTSLKSITIPDSVTSIGDEAFEDCSSLKDIYIDMTEKEFIKACKSTRGNYRYKLCIPNQTIIHFK